MLKKFTHRIVAVFILVAIVGTYNTQAQSNARLSYEYSTALTSAQEKSDKVIHFNKDGTYAVNYEKLDATEIIEYLSELNAVVQVNNRSKMLAALKDELLSYLNNYKN